MKKTILIGILTAQALLLNAQRPYVPSHEEIRHLLKTRTYVVLEDNKMADFNFEIKAAMPEEWDLTEFDFITLSDFPEKSTDSEASFIYSSIVTFDRDRTESEYIFLHLSLGGENSTINDLRDIVSIPLGYSSANPDNYMFKLGLMLRFMQKHIRMLDENPGLISSNMFRHYNENMSDVKKKTLYLVEDELAKDVSRPAGIRALYPYDFKIVTRDDIRQAIEEKDESIVFLHKVGPEGRKLRARCYKILIGAGDANFYYYNHHIITPRQPDGFLSSDFRRIAR